jgi:hypothetical protein
MAASASAVTKGEISVIPGFIPTGYYCSLVEEIEFQSVKWGSAGRVLPRKVAQFTYNEIYQNLVFMPNLDAVIMLFCTQMDIDPRRLSFWFNLYEDGNHYTPYHRDSYGCKVYTISFGGTRDFLSKDNDGNTKKYTLNDGDLMIFDEEWNEAHTHSVPKSKTQNAPRISMVIFIQDDV